MKRMLIQMWFLFAFLSVSIVSFSQQGGQADSTKRSNPANTGMQNQQGQNSQSIPANSGSQGGQGGQAGLNENSFLQPTDSYPVNQNLEMNKRDLINPLTNSLVYPAAQNSQSNQGMQAPAGTGVQNNNPAVPKDKGNEKPI